MWRNQRVSFGVRVDAVADAEKLHHRQQGAWLTRYRWHTQLTARSQQAELAGICEGLHSCDWHRALDIDVGANDDRRLATEFERYTLEVAGLGANNALAGLGRSG